MSADEVPVPRPRPVVSPRIDGRRLRSERTKQLIIEAYLALAFEKSPRVPTAAEIAQRAGYSVRSVFERFPDIHTLQVAAADYALVQVAALAPVRDHDGDRQTRIKTQVGTRARTCERWLPLWRSLIVNQGDLPALKQRIMLSRERAIARLELMYAPELATLSARKRRDLLIVLEALTDVESWARMREFFGLSYEEACEAWERATDRLLPATAGEFGVRLTEAPATVRTDGRRLRSARTRQRIVEAYLALLRDSPRIPTAAQIAETAGYSVRSVFERFPDLHSLRLAATDYAFAQGVAQSIAVDFDGDRETRIRNHVRARSAICDHWLPLWRAMIANHGDSEGLKSRIFLIRQAILKRIELAYTAELSTLNETDRRRDADRPRGADRFRLLGPHALVLADCRARRRRMSGSRRSTGSCRRPRFLDAAGPASVGKRRFAGATTVAAVAQLVRAPDCDFGCRRFNSGRPPQSVARRGP